MQQDFNNENNVFKERYTFLDSVRTFFYALLIPEVAMIALMIVTLVIIGLAGGNMDATSKSAWFLIFINIMSNVALFLFYIIYNKKSNIQVFKASKIKKEFSYKTFFIVLVMSIVSFACCVMFINLLAEAFAKLGYHPDNSTILPLDNFWNYLVLLFVLAVLPAFIEELIYRGVVFNGIKSRYTLIPAVLFSGFLFMIMHGSLNQSVYQFLIGIILCLIMFYTDNIVYCMVFHFVNNFIVVTLEYILTATGNPMVFDFGVWWQVVLAVGIFILGLAILFGFTMWLKKIYARNDEVVDNKTRKLSKEEIFYLIFGLALALFMWIYMTVVDFL